MNNNRVNIALKVILLLSALFFFALNNSIYGKPVVKTVSQKVIIRDKIKPSALNIGVKDIKFYFKPDAEIFFNEIKDKAIKSQSTRLQLDDLADFYRQAYDKASGYRELNNWIEGSNSAPYIFDSAIYVLNNDDKVAFNIKVLVKLKVKVGLLRLDPDTLTTDYDYLSSTANWYDWNSYSFTIPVLASNEIKELNIRNLCLIDLFKNNSNLWPEILNVSVKIFHQNGYSAKEYNKSLKIIPDQFQAQKSLY